MFLSMGHYKFMNLSMRHRTVSTGQIFFEFFFVYWTLCGVSIVFKASVKRQRIEASGRLSFLSKASRGDGVARPETTTAQAEATV
jgi:hypothetical protein